MASTTTTTVPPPSLFSPNQCDGFLNNVEVVDDAADNNFDISSIVTQVQKPQQQQLYSTSTTVSTSEDQAAAADYDDENISSQTIYDSEQVVVEEVTATRTTSNVQQQQQRKSVTLSRTVQHSEKNNNKQTKKRNLLSKLFKPIIRCFNTPHTSPNKSTDDKKTPTKHQQSKLEEGDEINVSSSDVDVVDVESTYTSTTTTIVTTTTTMVTQNNSNNNQQQKKKKKKKKKRSIHGSSTTFAVSSRGKTKALLGPQAQNHIGRKTLVLDLDETLVHSKFEPVAGADFQIPIDIEGRQHMVYVMKRPGVDEFLEEMSKMYEIVIFTASLSKYANPLLDKLDKKGVISGRLFREHCTYIDQCYVKDMSRLGRDIDSTLIIDNSPTCYAFQPRNAMPCTSWFEDQSDTELLQMIPWLQKLSQERTVYETLDQWRQYFVANCQWY